MGSVNRISQYKLRRAAAEARTISGKLYIGAYSFLTFEPSFRGQGKGELMDLGGPRPRRELKLLTTKEAASFLDLSVSTLAYYRMNYHERGVGPGFFRFGKLILYDLTDLKEWRKNWHRLRMGSA